MKIMIEPEFSHRYPLGFLKTTCFEIRFKKNHPLFMEISGSASEYRV